MKENDGRGATRRKYVKYTFVVAGVVGLMFFLSLAFQLLLASSSSSSSTSSSSYGNKWAPPNDRVMLRQQQEQQQRKRHGLLNRNRHDVTTKYKNEHQQADNTDSTDLVLQGILEGHLHIMDIRPIAKKVALMLQENADTANNKKTAAAAGGPSLFSYRGAFMASFCHLDWSLPKADPSTTPMFRWLVGKSPGCDDPYELDLYDVVEKVKQFDAQENSKDGHQKVKLLNLTGVVFHESRCGSTLVANVLAAMNPAQHRVYSESSPPIVILRMVDGEDEDGKNGLSVPQAAEILKDVVYLMSRSDDFKEERVFFKIQSIGTRSLNVFQQAFPTTPWIFVYRDPVQVMMSYLAHSKRNANCVRHQQSPPLALERIVAKYSTTHQRARDLSYQDFCAVHLASLTETALEYLENSSDRNLPVNYVTLPDIMWTDILPHRWNVPTGPDEIRRMQLVATQYSKQGKDGPADSGVKFTGDSQKKEEAASPAIRMAAQRYLQPSFEALEKVAKAKMH